MPKRREYELAHTELTLFSFQCKSCQVEMIVDWNNKRHRAKIVEVSQGNGRLVCSLCRTEFDRTLYEAFGSFNEYFSRLTRAAQIINFRIPYPDPK